MSFCLAPSCCVRTGSERKNCMASFMIHNGITRLKHLRFIDHPRTWDDATRLTSDELDFVWELRRAARARSRCLLAAS